MSSSTTRARIRPYESSDAERTLQVFIDAIQVTAAVDYSPEQVSAWARPGSRDVDTWNRAMLARGSYIALIGDEVAGFSDVSTDGYIDMMFVAPQYARRGVARELLVFLESVAREMNVVRLFANVSITARPFFEAMGFHVEAEQHPVIGGVAMTNFRMEKELAG